MYITVESPQQKELIDQAVTRAILSKFTSVELLDEVKRRIEEDNA